MIGKSLASDFQYTKLKYKQYPYFSSNISLMFLLCFFLFSLFPSPCFFFVYLNFYLMHYLDNNAKHQKVIYPPYSRNCEVLQKKTQKTNKNIPIPCNKKAMLITHYWQTLLITGYSNSQQVDKFLVEVLSMGIANMPVTKSILYC